MDRQNRVKALFCILVGISMVALWSMLLVTKQVAELIPTPFTTITHISAETLTGICLIISGIGLFRGSTWANRFFLFASGCWSMLQSRQLVFILTTRSRSLSSYLLLLVIIAAVFVINQLRTEN